MQTKPDLTEHAGAEVMDGPTVSDYGERLDAIRYDLVGFVEALVLSPRMDEHCNVETLAVLPGEGPIGQYPGKLWWRGARTVGRQISAVNAEVLDALEIAHHVPGDNLVVRGIDLAQFEPGDVLRVGDVLLTATPTPHRPCAKLARRTSLAKMRAITSKRYRGTMFDAIRAGTIRRGDSIERLLISRP